jgi:hypothetical protein
MTGVFSLGDPNTQAYFGPTGALTDDLDATMTTADWIQSTFPGGPQAIHVNRAIRSVAIGDSSVASGTNSFAQGNNAQASGLAAHASGIQTAVFRDGQWGHSSGQGGLSAPAIGNSQADLVTMTGETPGGAPTQSVELVLGSIPGPLVLEDGKDYSFTVTVAVGAVQPGPTRVARTFIIYFNVRRDAGVSVITASGVGQAFGDATTADWTFVASIGIAPDRVVLTFTTGAINSAAKVTAEVRFVEIAY